MERKKNTIKGKIKSKRLETNKDTYDIQTKNNNFFANGVLVHNSEIILRSMEFCNLTEVIVREDDSIDDIKKKAELATILGTFQSTLTDFKYIRKSWKENCEDERLLGVSMTGIMDNPLLNDYTDPELPKKLEAIRDHTIKVNQKYAKDIGIEPSAAITCIKPSGCATLDTKIRTTDGDKTFAQIFYENEVEEKDMFTGNWIDPINDIFVYDENNDTQKVSKLYVNGLYEVFEIEDEEGNTYSFTGNHKLKTKNGWKRVDELTINDEIVEFINTSVNINPTGTEVCKRKIYQKE